MDVLPQYQTFHRPTLGVNKGLPSQNKRNHEISVNKISDASELGKCKDDNYSGHQRQERNRKSNIGSDLESLKRVDNIQVEFSLKVGPAAQHKEIFGPTRFYPVSMPMIFKKMAIFTTRLE